MERDTNFHTEHSTAHFTVGDKIAHELYHLETIPDKVRHLISLGTVNIADPQAYIETQIQKIKLEIERLKKMDPTAPYYMGHFGTNNEAPSAE